MELQHINVKLLVADPERVDLAALIPVFHSWIQGQVCEGLLLDVADYRHVFASPGVVLIGHEANYSLDNSNNRLGVRYNRKAAREGTNADRLTQATQAALRACQLLEEEPRLEGKIRFNGRDVEVFVNDRLLASNSEATRQAVDSDLRAFFQRLFRDGAYALSYGQEPRALFSVCARARQPLNTASLLNNLNAVGVDTQSQRIEKS